MSMPDRPPFPWSAWAVHLVTATGAVWAFMALLAVIEGDALACFLWLGLALIVDGIDGPLARMARVKERIPDFNGEALDLIVDYLTYVFIPAVFLWRFQMLPEPLLLPGCALVLLTSLHLFVKADMKAGDNHFVGFPAIWNVVVLSLYLLGAGPWVAALVVALLSVLTFAPVLFVHPFRVVRFRPVTLAAMGLWAAATLALLFTHPERPLWAVAPWLLACGWYLGLSLWRTTRG